MDTRIIEINDKEYPVLLREIPKAPKKLYVRGRTELFGTRCAAIAGSRKASRAGLHAAELIAKRLAQAGFTIVSGLAEGVDTAAHRGALSAEGNTIAVLANGLDKIYPASNRLLKEEIENKGLLVSEYPDGLMAKKYFFPRRNRIISGISEFTVIAEAALRSGSLITAEAAAEQGREVFAVAGNFTLSCTAGTNHLISAGASPIYDINLFLDDVGVSPEAAAKHDLDLSNEEALIYDSVKREGEVTTEMLVKDTLLPAGMVNGIVTVLELKGLVYTEMGKVFLSVS